LTGIVTKSTGSWYTVMDEQGKRHSCKLRGKLKISGNRSTNPVAVGDRVKFLPETQNQPGLIEDINDRSNYIVRKATNLSRRKHVIAANIDQAVIIATLARPKTSTGFIDRFLVTCEAYSIPAVIVFNKMDLIDTEEAKEYLHEITMLYEDIGYPCLHVSATQKINLENFDRMLEEKTSLLSGHSGVGKSALINAIEPGLNLKVQSISRAHQKGKHTTTFAEMFPLSNGGFIIDTPGIKEFGMVDYEPWEFSHYFPEMRKYFNQCRFDNCTHYNEPGCKVKEKVEEGSISISRYSNYLNILLDIDTRS